MPGRAFNKLERKFKQNIVDMKYDDRLSSLIETYENSMRKDGKRIHNPDMQMCITHLTTIQKFLKDKKAKILNPETKKKEWGYEMAQADWDHICDTMRSARLRLNSYHADKESRQSKFAPKSWVVCCLPDPDDPNNMIETDVWINNLYWETSSECRYKVRNITRDEIYDVAETQLSNTRREPLPVH